MSINYLAVLVAAIVNMAVGALWYSPALFAKPWMKLTAKKDMGSPGPGYALSTLGSLLIAFFLADFAVKTSTTGFGRGLVLGLLAWIGFVATTYAASYVFEGRPLKLYALNVGYYLVTFMLMGGIVAAWH
jgi:hypothetical protein